MSGVRLWPRLLDARPEGRKGGWYAPGVPCAGSGRWVPGFSRGRRAPSFRAQPRAVVPVFDPGFALTLGACLDSELCRGRVRVHVGGLRKRGEGRAGRWERAVGAGKPVVWGAEGLWCPSPGYLVPERVHVHVHAHQALVPLMGERMIKKGDRRHAWGWLLVLGSAKTSYGTGLGL